MGTSEKVKKSHTPRKFSQSSLRNLTKKPKPSDIFDDEPPAPDEETELMDRLSRQAIEDEKARQKVLNHVFTKGQRYIIEKDYIFEYLEKEGIHHIFREINGGWTRCYTDPQLIGKTIEEVKS